MIDDALLETHAAEYTQKSTHEWGMTFLQFLELKVECQREINETLLEVANGEKK